jgi:hypothetical protein
MGCATSKEKTARKTEQADRVESALAERHYKIAVNMMIDPSETEEKVNQLLPQPYRLEVRNDSLISYLPYFGRAYDVPYGGGKGLNFTAPVGSYQESMGKNGMRIIEVGTQNEEDRYLYRIEVFDNGRSTIDVLSQNRETISFSGEMTFD